ncbi:heterokaryon incompatibility protein-domain-containing protein [Podospora aff. communis PSN243]|uniref:Heterokaryon incompatibility protein-domain-containing protein n=1 Tax=Podospora aff. communis PSN243 TaxID=3040156 RepID=A0AAV9GM27_9PEZI|nr:heterokaryon incompatibility protein-domain-containing protein [Podospora aff. communis PSN243]
MADLPPWSEVESAEGNTAVPSPDAQNPIDPKWTDVSLLRNWIRTCIAEHGPACWPEVSLTGSPLWLIDVDFQCLVPFSQERAYVALSYVWGQVESAETLKDNLHAFQQPGAFAIENENGDSNVIIPKTIRHAIGLVAMLGQRYLWVDRLCICQDDREVHTKQIDTMGDIYNNAIFTIIAANGWDANHGLRGIKGLTPPRNLPPHLESQDFELIEPSTSVWYSRGWTFQELLLSSRKLKFHYNVAIWECKSAQWHEIHGVQPRPLSTTGLARFRVAESTLNDVLENIDSPVASFLGAFFNLVNSYNHRQLTFSEDALRAFSGVSSATTKIAYPAGFLWGLPFGAFCQALLWMAEEPLQRRKPSTPGGEVMPSWSWVGWQGRIKEDTWAPHFFDERTSTVHDIQHYHQTECEWAWLDENGDVRPAETSEMEQHRPSRWLCTVARTGTMTAVKKWRQDVEWMLPRMLFRYLSAPNDSNRVGVLVPDSPTESFGHGPAFDVKLMVISRTRGILEAGLVSDASSAAVRDYYDALWIGEGPDGLCRKGIARVIIAAWDMLPDLALEDVILG